jgi:hypothetical protein
MFASQPLPTNTISTPAVAAKPPRNAIYPMHHAATTVSGDVTLNAVDLMLESEKRHNKSDTWNKLDKTAKLQKLHAFAERYARDHGLPTKPVSDLKTFFIGCLEKNKLQKTKELVYDKELREIVSIPSLFLNAATNAFTLKITDTKRVSTLKALTLLRGERG